MKITKLISILLAVLMLVGSLTILVSADGGASTPKYSTNTGDGNSLMMPDPNNEGQYLYREGKYVDADGNAYDFAYGLNWSGRIEDARTAKYAKS